MDCPDYNKAKKEAELLVKQYGSSEPFISVLSIIQNEGITIKEFDENDITTLKNIAGFFDPKTKTIYINRNDPPNRKTFTIAHELGHFKLDHTPDKYSVLPRWQLPGKEKDPIEKEADSFAANLLVPKLKLDEVKKKFFLQESDTAILSKIFGVSEDVIRFRMKSSF